MHARTAVYRPRKKPRHLESIEQRALIEWAGLQLQRFPELAMLVAVPNGGARSKIEAAIMKGEGVQAGFPDLMLLVPRGPYHGLFIELKQPGLDERAVSEAQWGWIFKLRQCGYMVRVAFGWDQAREALKDYLIPHRKFGEANAS